MTTRSFIIKAFLLVFVLTPALVERATADDNQLSPHQMVMAFLRSLSDGRDEETDAMITEDFTDTFHANLGPYRIAERVKLFCELSTTEQALVVAKPIQLFGEGKNIEVLYATLRKTNSGWKIRKFGRTSSENISWMISGFQMHSDVKSDLISDGIVGEWWYLCNSTIIFNLDGTGSNFVVGPGGPVNGDKPEPFTWTLRGSTLTLQYANKQEIFSVSAENADAIRFGGNVDAPPEGHLIWHRKIATTPKP